jgi:Ca-activated chloride channel family protein
MTEFFSQFHLLRPMWLLALLPALILFAMLLKQRLASARWHGIIDEVLLPHVLDKTPTEQQRWPLWFVLLAWILASVGLAGPSWEKLPQPVQKNEDALIILLDMSLSMGASDMAPDRATRAKQKTIDILQQRKDGLTALIVYAGDAHTVTPLTDDTETISNLVPALSPFIMPAKGSRPEKAIELANQLLQSAGLNKADYLLITDGIQSKDISRIENALSNSRINLGIIAVGTDEGAPISLPDSGFLRNQQGEIVLPKLELGPIKALAQSTGAQWYPISYDDSDWAYLTENKLALPSQESLLQQTQFDLWSDQGFWLVPLIMLIMLFSFRRGWLLTLPLLLLLPAEDSQAFEWQDLWKNKDQQGAELFDSDPALAQELFENPDWKASAAFRAGDYETSANGFVDDSNLDNEQRAERLYNKATAQAKGNQLEQALESYDQALGLNPNHEDAAYNKSIVEQLIQQQQQQQDSQQGEDGEQSNQDQSQNDQQQSDSQQQDQGSSAQQQGDQQDGAETDSKPQTAQPQDTDQQADQQEEQEQQAEQQQQQTGEDQQGETTEQQAQQQAQGLDEQLSREEQQALKQWLNRVPDDPGGLLRRKFLYQYQQRGEQQEGEIQW